MVNQDANKPEIMVPAPLGGKSSVSLGGNRYSIKSESLYKAANAIAIPARGGLVDGAMWVSAYAVVFRLPFSLLIQGWLPPYMAIALVMLVLLPTCTWLSQVAHALPDHRSDCWARLVMILIALLIATNGFWLRGAL
jgi:hypothetical protein